MILKVSLGKSFSVFMSRIDRQKAMHDVRQRWRITCLQRWLDADRVDSNLAQTVQLVIDDQLVNKLRLLWTNILAPHARAVMLGGMRTVAGTPWGSSRPEDGCPDCQNLHVFPSVHHVLWECPVYENLRSIPVPNCRLAQRLGWSHVTPTQVSVHLIQQMGRIREAEVCNRMRRLRAERAHLHGGQRRAADEAAVRAADRRRPAELPPAAVALLRAALLVHSGNCRCSCSSGSCRCRIHLAGRKPSPGQKNKKSHVKANKKFQKSRAKANQ